MSDSLTESALDETPVGASVEVDAGSDSSASDVVPASRFNGLMASLNKAKDEAAQREAALAARIQELEAELSNSRPSTPEVPVADEQVEALNERVALLAEMLLKERQAAVLDKYPEAKAFADLIRADDPETYEAMAKEVAERVRKVAPPATEQTPTNSETTPAAAPPAAPEAPVIGGGSSVEGAPVLQDRITEAVKNRQFGSWFRAKLEQQAATGN